MRGRRPKKSNKVVAKESEASVIQNTVSSAAFRRILALLHEQAEIDVSQYKPTTIARRIQRHMSIQRVAKIEAYLELLVSNPDLIKALADEIFIHVTEFFRDSDSFEALAKNVLPKLAKTRPASAPLRVWVPGCSTGEECYSIAMALLEFADSKKMELPFQIFATDISDGAVEKARSGLYLSSDVEGLSEKRIATYFDKLSDGYKIKKPIRDACVFSRHDLIKNPPFARIDLVSCRNVLIYFDPHLQKHVLPIFHYSLNPGGFLWLGRSESPIGISKLFSLIDKPHKIFSKVNTATPMSVRFPMARPHDRLDHGKKTTNHFAAAFDHQKEIERIGFSRYAPAGAVINADMEVIQVKGHTSPFLELPAGQPTYNFMKMVRPDLLPGARSVIQEAQRTNASARKEGLTYLVDGVRRKVDLEVIPVNPHSPQKERQYLVFFEAPRETIKKGLATRKPAKSKRSKGDDPEDTYIAELLREIDSMREYQQSLAEGYESSQEELTSSNEELQSTLEEFQSTNEELETSKEEMHATNEELATVNEELHRRNEELAKSEERFRLLVEGVKDYAIFSLDPAGIVTSWNEGARRLKKYESSEITGQHFSRFYTVEDIRREHPQHELEVAFKVGRYEEEGWRVRKDGTKFWASVLITRIDDSAGNHVGFSKVTRDLTDKKRMEDELRSSRDQLETRVKERTEELEEALKVRDEFLSIASHELKTPLTSVKLQLQITQRNTQPERHLDPKDLSRSLNLSLRQVDSMADLVESLLDIARIRAGRFSLSASAFDLSDLAQAVTNQLAEQLKKAKVETELRLDKNVTGRWDQRRLEQVLNNLVANVIKYAPGTRLTIETRRTEDSACLTVTDSGPGIRSEKLPRIFERFERAGASKSVGGLGLGLFITKKIVEAHGGKISVESAFGKGTKFCIELPLGAEEG
jgi:two-component system CheB/CheR fusion protein